MGGCEAPACRCTRSDAALEQRDGVRWVARVCEHIHVLISWPKVHEKRKKKLASAGMHVRRARTIDLSAVRNVHRHPVSALQVCSTGPPSFQALVLPAVSRVCVIRHPTPLPFLHAERKEASTVIGSGRRASRIGQEGASVGDVKLRAECRGPESMLGVGYMRSAETRTLRRKDEERPLRGTLTLGD